MANFTNESLVRLRFQASDTTLVSSELVNAAIDDAHAELLRFLDPQFDTGNPEEALVMGETLLAGAHLFHALAAGEAFGQKRVTIGGQRVEESERYDTLTALARTADEQAWYILEPYIEDRPSRSVSDSTDTIPVLGGE